jgi:hypothetical protein
VNNAIKKYPTSSSLSDLCFFHIHIHNFLVGVRILACQGTVREEARATEISNIRATGDVTVLGWIRKPTNRRVFKIGTIAAEFGKSYR